MEIDIDEWNKKEKMNIIRSFDHKEMKYEIDEKEQEQKGLISLSLDNSFCLL